MKNYARALANFALSNIAIPYLRVLINKSFNNKRTKVHQNKETTESELCKFRVYIERNKEKVNCIKQLRELLLGDTKDPAETIRFKELFKDISVVFLKFFSVNWLYSSKIGDKVAHLKYRLKLLRRVQNPEFFTHLEEFSRK